MEDIVCCHLQTAAWRVVLVEHYRIVFGRSHLLHFSSFDHLDLLLLFPFVKIALLTDEAALESVLEGIEEIVVELTVSIVVRLLGYALLDGGSRPLVVVVTPVGPLGAVVHREGLLLE
jgi:hypothetical protein